VKKTKQCKLENLQEVLVNSLKKEILSIKQLDKNSQKFHDVSLKFPVLKTAEYVIFSKYMSKEFHDSESFIFVDEKGSSVVTISGRDLELYDMIKECEKFKEQEKRS